MPKISIITPCYNAQAFIERTIQSVRNQTVGSWEHIVVDDGSTDNSAEVVERILPLEPRLRLVRQPHRGKAFTCNNGFRHCSADSEHLLILDADDCLKPQMLEVLNRHLDLHPDVGVVSCDYQCIDAQDNPIDKKTFGYLGPRCVPTLIGARELPPDALETPFASVFTLSCFLCTMGLIRRSTYENTPGWDEDFGLTYDDTDLLFHLAIRSKVHYISQELAQYRRHSTQDTVTGALSREPRQRHKLYSKWLQMDGLTSQQRKTIIEANRFREGKLRMFINFRSGNSYLKRGELYRAARSYYGGMRAYIGYLARRLSGDIP